MQADRAFCWHILPVKNIETLLPPVVLDYNFKNTYMSLLVINTPHPSHAPVKNKAPRWQIYFLGRNRTCKWCWIWHSVAKVTQRWRRLNQMARLYPYAATRIYLPYSASHYCVNFILVLIEKNKSSKITISYYKFTTCCIYRWWTKMLLTHTLFRLNPFLWWKRRIDMLKMTQTLHNVAFLINSEKLLILMHHLPCK